MKIAYLVLTHKNPHLLKRTIQALSCDDSAFFIHVDRKSDIAPFSIVEGDNIFFTHERLAVFWGEYSVVRAVLLLMRQALASSEKFDYLVLLSGSEYPLRSRKYIHAYLDANRDAEFIHVVKVPSPGKPLSRFSTVRYGSEEPIRRFVYRALAKLGMAQRDISRHLKGLNPYSGRMWWALSADACRFVLEYIEQHPQLEDFFAHTFAPDESFFHTILGNSEFSARIRNNLHFEDWSASGPHPAMINSSHVAYFKSCTQVFDGGLTNGPAEALFTRKFSDDNLAILDSIDEMIAQKDGT